MPENAQYRALYDADGNIVLEYIGLREEIEDVEESEESEEIEEEPERPFLGAGKARYAAEGLRFVGTFSAVFVFLFVVLNFESYSQMMRAMLLSDASGGQRTALQQLLSAPELPRAGNADAVLPELPTVSPPDNRIIIPKIGKNIPLIAVADAALRRGDWSTFESDVQNALMHGVVHYPGTARPGEIGNVFMTGHSSNYPWISSKYNAVFALLPTLEVGDGYSVFFAGELYRYRVAEKYEVSPKEVSVLDQPKDRYMSTLMTCTPIGTTLKRLIIHGEEIDEVGEVIAVDSDDAAESLVEDWGEVLPM